jgi:hypothetical protein
LRVEQGQGAVGDAGDVRAAAALGDEPAAGPEGIMKASKEGGMVLDPMEGGGAEDDVCRGLDGEFEQVGLYIAHTVAEAGAKVGFGLGEHIGGLIHGNDLPLGEAFEEQFGQAAGATPRVDDGFVATEGEAFENDLAPVDVWIGDLVIGGGIPFAAIGTGGGHGWSSWAVKAVAGRRVTGSARLLACDVRPVWYSPDHDDSGLPANG